MKLVQIAEEKELALVINHEPRLSRESIIEVLMRYLRFEELQAEQCASIIQTTGSYVVKTGTFKKLRPFLNVFQMHGLEAEINNQIFV